MTGISQPGIDLSLPANVDLSGSQYKAVVLTADGIEVVGSDGPVTGFLQDNNADAAGRVGRVRVVGVALARAGAAFARGVWLEIDADGDVVESGAAGTAYAQALEEADGEGAIVKVLITRTGSLTPVTV